MNLDSITFDDILESFDNQTVNVKEIDRFYRKMYHEKLEKYMLVSPYDVKQVITKGSVIRYIKKDSNELSCASFVMKIKKDESNDYFILSMLRDSSKLWKIYPSNHYIFVYDVNITTKYKLTQLTDKLIAQKKSFIQIPLEKRAMRSLLKDTKLDNEINKMLENKVVKAPYSNKKVNPDNLDDTLNNIFDHEKKKRNLK